MFACTLQAILSIYYSVGSLFTALLGLIFLPRSSDHNGWRIVCVALSVLGYVLAACRWYLPETPMYLGTSADVFSVARHCLRHTFLMVVVVVVIVVVMVVVTVEVVMVMIRCMRTCASFSTFVHVRL